MDKISATPDIVTLENTITTLLQSLETEQQIVAFATEMLAYLGISGILGLTLGVSKEVFLKIYTNDTEAYPIVQLLVRILEKNLEIYLTPLILLAALLLLRIQQPQLAGLATIATLTGVSTAVFAHVSKKYLDKVKPRSRKNK